MVASRRLKLHAFVSVAIFGFVIALLGMAQDYIYLGVIGVVVLGSSIACAITFVVVVALRSRGKPVVFHEVKDGDGKEDITDY
jgi:NADH:ubiquinone oxidoreductase subunit 6 (subunit J)